MSGIQPTPPWGIAQLVTTDDGSHTFWLPEWQEHYHSTHGAIQEAQHVFVAQGFHAWQRVVHPSPIQILEIGLGTGLNALLTYVAAGESGSCVDYLAIEPFPVSWVDVQQLNYVGQLVRGGYSPIKGEEFSRMFSMLHLMPEGRRIQLRDGFSLEKDRCTLETYSTEPNSFDIVYFDAFAPSKQPAMWALDLLQKVYRLMRTPGLLVTYCAQGQFRRHLRGLGMRVEVLPGPPGKKEMTRAWKEV